jgi:hypothetical protein
MQAIDVTQSRLMDDFSRSSTSVTVVLVRNALA